MVYPIKKFVVIRTYSAGVHFGTLEEVDKKGTMTVRLSKSRRLWSWNGALSLHEVSTKGVDIKNSKISDPVDEIVIDNVIEIIPVSKDCNLPGNE